MWEVSNRRARVTLCAGGHQAPLLYFSHFSKEHKRTASCQCGVVLTAIRRKTMDEIKISLNLIRNCVVFLKPLLSSRFCSEVHLRSEIFKCDLINRSSERSRLSPPPSVNITNVSNTEKGKKRKQNSKDLDNAVNSEQYFKM